MPAAKPVAFDDFEAMVASLDSISRDVLRRVYHSKDSLDEIASALGTTVERVSAIWMRGLRAVSLVLESSSTGDSAAQRTGVVLDRAAAG